MRLLRHAHPPFCERQGFSVLVGLELRGVLRANAGGTPQSPVATKKVPQLWEQDAAGSNPVSPMREKVIPQLTSPPLRKGRFFNALASKGVLIRYIHTR